MNLRRDKAPSLGSGDVAGDAGEVPAGEMKDSDENGRGWREREQGRVN